jgi:hypothetical protein
MMSTVTTTMMMCIMREMAGCSGRTQWMEVKTISEGSGGGKQYKDEVRGVVDRSCSIDCLRGATVKHQ